MGIKNKLGVGIMSAALGLSLISGGTYAYFSDSVETTNTFAAGTIDLEVEPTEIVELDELKPGDSAARTFTLLNNGSLDIEKVLLETDYTVDDAEGDNSEDFGEHIQVEFLYNVDQVNEVIYETTLAELKDMTPEAVSDEVFLPIMGEEGLAAGTKDDFLVKFEFIDNDEDQNEFQGDTLNLEWTFNAMQTDGEEK